MLRRLIVAGMAIAAFGTVIGVASAQTLDKIKQRGALVVGTKADYKPYGFRDPNGAIVEYELDHAKDVTEHLTVKLEARPVISSNRMQFLQQSQIDLMLATMNVTDERSKSDGNVDPSYYASGVNVFAV